MSYFYLFFKTKENMDMFGYIFLSLFLKTIFK